MRCLSDGPYVFLHVYQNLNEGAAQWVTTDLFRSDANGRIVGHWDVIDAYQKNESGQDPVFGEFVVTYSNVLIDGTACAQFDIFRLEDGKIAEHWSK